MHEGNEKTLMKHSSYYGIQTKLCYAQSDGEESKRQSKGKMNASKLAVRRLNMKGVSVSPIGFVMLYQTPNNLILPLRVTSSALDYHFTTTPESLTVCQLMTGVDMAGLIFNPDVLNCIVGLFCSASCNKEDDKEIMVVEDELGLDSSNFFETEDEDWEDNEHDDEMCTVEFVHQFLSTTLGRSSYEEANTWQKSRCVFPKISLDSVRIDIPTFADENSDYDSPILQTKSFKRIKDVIMDQGDQYCSLIPVPFKFTLECRVDGDKALDIHLYSESSLMKMIFNDETTLKDFRRSENILHDVCYNHDKETSAAFLALSLALRYRCPVVMTSRALDAISNIQETMCHMKIVNRGPNSDSDPLSVCITQPTEIETENIVSERDDDTLIRSVLPQWKSIYALQTQSQRVVENIEQGFKIQQLERVKDLALEKGDYLAAERIQMEIDRLLQKSDNVHDIDTDSDENTEN